MISKHSLWHYAIDGKVAGPVDLATLRTALRGRATDEGVSVREDGSDTWVRPTEISGLLGPFIGPPDADWPNSPTKVFLSLAAVIVAFEIDVPLHTSLALPGAAIAIVYVVVRDPDLSGGRLRPGEAFPLACVIGLACAFAVAYAATLTAAKATPGWFGVASEVVVPLALAGWYVSRRSKLALAVLLGLEMVALAVYALSIAFDPSDILALFITPVAIHAAAVVGFFQIAVGGKDNA